MKFQHLTTFDCLYKLLFWSSAVPEQICYSTLDDKAYMSSGTAKGQKPTPYDYLNVLANFLTRLSSTRAWYYSIVGEANSDDATLSSLLGIPEDIYTYILQKCELITLDKNGKMTVSKDKWRDVLIQGFGLHAFGVQHHDYQLTRTKPDGTTTKVRTHFVLVGSFSFYDKKWDFREIKKHRKPRVRVPALRDDFIKNISLLLCSELGRSKME